MAKKTMHAVQLTRHGDLDALVYRDDVPRPEPARGEVLIEVSACGMNNTDVWVRQGAYGTETDPDSVSTWRRGRSTLTFPRIQGTDIVGTVVAVGEGVPEARIGERVMVDFSLYNRADDSLADIDYIGHGRDGGYAEYTAVPSENAHVVDTDMSDAELATFCCAYLTGEHMLERARVQAGERVLVTGASGGVGSGIIQLCRARGAIPYAVTSRDKAEAVRGIGAEAVIPRESGDLVTAVDQATEGRPIDVVADLVAGPLFNDLLRVLRPEGRYTTAGAIAGPVVQLDLRTLYLKHLQLHGSSQGTRGDFRRLVGYIERGQVRALLYNTYRLSDFHRAQRDFMEKSYIGKLVVVPDRKWDEVGRPHAR
ncbi:alcohol dehydrogenase family protein [Alkalilimnicola ehrlichii MLHE-1]|uniref:Alcohol dehydrogenase, zinc-binding domain protein n=1 Tax=Alkalilimnicola ehrlichii (strain ATCC BAA-1101 / DSM 17681 / MLHE-1) TaxID=187272 RepID=Q0A6Y6_ALKEH|nr:alcohol dehydrogenase family protein [Alkalilimnicola ehrlichii]ABI57401.1 Alcohol dehydrogenase, zinc-binding domain protein [Alkalilimnicola ehrlichii MLHE-1]